MAKVVFLDQYAGLGGGQRILMDLAAAFRAAGHEVRVLLPGTGAARDALLESGFPVLALPLPEMTAGRKPMGEKMAYPLHARRAAAAVIRELREPADLLYANAPRCFLPAVLAARKTRIPVICGLHLIFTGGIEHRLVRWCFRQPQVRRAVFCSEAVAAPFAASCEGKGLLVPYWVSPAFLELPQDRAGARARLGLGGGEVAVGVLGRISRTKGQRFFLEALLPLLGSFPELRLFVAGTADFEDPGEETAVKGLAEGSAGPSRVTVTGSMVESMPFLDAMDVLVVPSLWEEPFGLVAVEGMARRLPVVVTKSGGLKEIVEDGATGFQVDKDPLALREAVRLLLEDPGLRDRMGEAGRARVEERFHPQKQMGVILGACL